MKHDQKIQIHRDEIVEIDPVNGITKTSDGLSYPYSMLEITDDPSGDIRVIHGLGYVGSSETVEIQVHVTPLYRLELPA